MKGLTGPNLMTMLESRLDNVVFRLGWARTRKEARQIVDHKFVTVNGKLVNIPSYLVKPGQTISLKESSRKLQIVQDALASMVSRKAYVSYDENTMVGTFVSLPERNEFLEEIKENLIVEFYNS